MGVTNEIKRKKERRLVSIPAKRLKEKLTPIKSRVDEMTRRWFWELLQNASDFNDTVRVKLEVHDNYIVFSHNGSPFRTEDVLNIISPDSGKEDDEITTKDNIGKFGSGLISTHVLSSQINVHGIFYSEEEKNHYEFNIDLDRSNPEDKERLIVSTKESDRQFQENCRLASYEPDTFQSHFKYDLTKSLEGIDGKQVAQKGIAYVIDILPYTLCFMQKILSVQILNQSRFDLGFKSYYIEYLKEEKDLRHFNLQIDQDKSERTFYTPKMNGVGTAIEMQEGQFMALPPDISKIFCGLPLIGTERTGLPIIINSLDFKPTTERDTLELSPNDKENRKLMLTGVEVYKEVLSFAAKNKIETAYHVARIKTAFNGIEGSKIWFRDDLVPLYKKQLLDATVLQNVKGEFIKVSESKIPNLLDYNEPFHEVASAFAPNKVPISKAHSNWISALDFNLFTSIKYSFESFLQDVTATKQLEVFVLNEDIDAIFWLKKVLLLVSDVDDSLYKRYDLFLNWNNKLCSKESIYLAKELPDALISINNSLKQESIGETLLHESLIEFSVHLGKDKVRDLPYLANRIDNSLKQLFSENAGSTATFIEPLRNLFKWYNSSGLEKKKLKELFSWFDNKRATLFLETFNEKERDQALVIAQSNKMESLAALAKSSLTNEQLQALAEKAHLIPKILEMLQGIADDKTTVSEATGNLGEEIVYQDLRQKYPDYQGFEVIWSSKAGEARFDFEVKKGEETLYYVDAKTTSTSIRSSETIPFYIRFMQWSFWEQDEAKDKYLLARVFLSGSMPAVKYIQVNYKRQIKQS